MSEVIVIPTYKREEMLHGCLGRIVTLEADIPIHIFPDRLSGFDLDFLAATRPFWGRVTVHVVPEHSYYGNSFNALESLRWAYNAGFDRVYYIESDVFIHEDFFTWHREMHEDNPSIFAACGWVFNRHAPIVEENLFQPWYYAIGTSFMRDKLCGIIRHASPDYYADMAGYIEKHFPNSKLNSPFGIMHFEHDGLIQRVLADRPGQLAVSCSIAKCCHMGFVRSYGAGDPNQELLVAMGLPPETPLEKRILRVESLYTDPYWRARQFGREIVEREIGHTLDSRIFRYRVRFDGWESEFISELTREVLPRKINSVLIPEQAEIELL
jgi:hypothetical protein